jgi:threonine-phosphate decarboxylase
VSLLRGVAAAVHGAVDPVALRAEGVAPEGLIDFSSNQSPLGAPAVVHAAVSAAAVDAYPDPHASAFCAAVAEYHAVPAACVVAGNGSTELIRLVAQLALAPGDTALSLGPSFGEYAVGTALAGGRFHEVRLEHLAARAGFRCAEPALTAALTVLRPRLCWLCSPNNPTGAALPAALIAALVRGHPGTLFVLDEAYCDLLGDAQWSPDLLAGANLIVLRSMTKTWGLAGLRLGYAVAEPGLAAALRAAAPPWSVNACAQAAGIVALADLEHHRKALEILRGERDRLTGTLGRAGWTVEPSSAGFFLVHVGDAAAARRVLLAQGCLVRDCTSFGLSGYVRLSPRLAADNDRLVAAFTALTTTGL